MRRNPLIPLALMVLPTFVAAQDYSKMAQLEVLPGWRTEAGDHIAALRITLEPGWITYWRAPGDAGIPPQFSIATDSAIARVTPHWPVPEVIDDKGMISIGYHDSVTVPLTVETEEVAGELQMAGTLTIGVCEEICIPVTFNFDTLLPLRGSHDPVIGAALADTPLTRAEAAVASVTCSIDPISDGLRMTTRIAVAQTTSAEHVVVEMPDPRIWVSQADVSRDGGTLSATVDMVHPSGQPFAFDRSGVRITVLGDDGHAIDLQGCSAG